MEEGGRRMEKGEGRREEGAGRREWGALHSDPHFGCIDHYVLCSSSSLFTDLH